MSAAIQILLTLVTTLLEDAGVASSSLIIKILAALSDLVPVIIAQAPALIAPVQNIIAVLKTSGPLSAEQLATLDALNAQCDAAFDGPPAS